jgi:hypothetical protein
MSVAIIALMGLGLDGARMFVERRQAQSAADLAALAGARSLPDDAAQATADAIAIAAANGYTITAGDVITPYDGDPSKIKVLVDSGVTMLFMPLLGIDDSAISASAAALHEEAVAGSEGDGGGFAIFAISDDCSEPKTIDLTSAFYSVGAWHSNSTMKSSSPNNPPGDRPGPLHQGTHTFNGSECGIGDGVGDDYDGEPDQVVWDTHWKPGGYIPDPLGPGTEADITVASFDVDPATPGVQCDYPADPDTGAYVGSWTAEFKPKDPGPHWDTTVDPPVLRPGVYCGSKMTQWPRDVVATITAIASEQIATSVPMDLKAHHESGILWAVLGPEGTPQDPTPDKDGCKNDAIKSSAPDLKWEGVLYAPCAEVDWTGPDGVTINGSIIADRIHISGTGWIFNGYEYPGAGGTIEAQPEVLALIE